MKKTKKIIKKFFLISLVSLEIILINVQPSQAFLGSLLGGILGSKGSASPNANGMLTQMEERYHLNKESIQNFGEGFNVSDQKSPAPEVDIFFNPSSPKFGEKVTATAIPKYFQEDKENMYFTWYIKHEGCEDGSTDNLELCDADGNGKVSSNDWKVEAMRNIASNGFVTEKSDYSDDTDDDGFKAHKGGRVNIQSIDYCYIHDFNSGEDYEIATAADGDNDDENGFDCEGGKVMCTSPYTLSCGILEGTNNVEGYDMGDATVSGGSSSTDGVTSGSTGGSATVDLYADAHSEEFEGTTIQSFDAHTDSGYEPACDVETKKIKCPEGTTGRCIKNEDLDLIDPKCSPEGEAAAGSANFMLSDVSINGTSHPFYMRCYEDGRLFTRFSGQGMDYCGGKGGKCVVTLETSSGTQTWSFDNPGGPEPHCRAAAKGCPGRYEDGSGFLWKSVGESTGLLAIFFPAEFAEGCGISNPGEQDVSCTTTLYSPDDVDLKCEHQFAASGVDGTANGSFGLEEERFWRTDPKNPSTAGNGKTDEQNVAGLGADKLTWTFVPGDKVGVIVEGLSYMGTKHDDSSNAITFSLVNNIFHKEGDYSDKGNPLCQIVEQETYVKEIKGYDVKIPFAKVDISDCLKWNLVSPTDGYQADNMDITMDYYPKNPNVGTKGLDGGGTSLGGDSLVVTANTSNQNLDSSQVYYKWSVYGFRGDRESLKLNRDDWTELSSDQNFRKNNNIGILEGLGMSEFKMQLNNINNYDFLRFYVESEEFFDTGSGTTGTTRSGRSDIIVEPNNSDANGINISIGSTPICETGGSCEVLKNQLITATLPAGGLKNYLWTLDGKPITAVSSGETSQGNTVSFLLEGNPGDYHTLNVVANDTASPGTGGNTGQKLNITRNFVVTKPMVGLGPNNKINRGSGDCKDLSGNVNNDVSVGSYKTLATSTMSSETVYDCREEVFEGSGTINLTPTFYPEWIGSKIKNVKYYVNGVSQESNSVDLSAYPEGTLVNVSYEGEYWQSDEERSTLKSWGLTEGDTSGEKIADSILIRVKNDSSTTVTQKASKVIASLAYNLPEQMVFMFRMLLTVMVIIFASGLMMSFEKKK